MRHTTPLDPIRLISQASIYSELPKPAGRIFIDAQGAVYYDGHFLHVWYGAAIYPPLTLDEFFYTRSANLLNWTSPVKVINSAIGLCCPASLVQNGYIYLFIQGATPDRDSQNQIPLYRIRVGVDYTNPANYTLIGNAVAVGPLGSFDAGRAACPNVIKIGRRIHLFYEAITSPWSDYTLAKAYSDDIEAVPYTKEGPLRDEKGVIFRNPANYIMAPHAPLSEKVISFCYSVNAYDVWRTSLLYNASLAEISGYRHIESNNNLGNIENGILIHHLTSLFFNNPLAVVQPSLTNSYPLLPPKDNGFCDWIFLTPVGIINGYYYFLMQGYNAGNSWPWLEFPHLYLMRTPLHVKNISRGRHVLKLDELYVPP